jgi:hypothetical protein
MFLTPAATTFIKTHRLLHTLRTSGGLYDDVLELGFTDALTETDVHSVLPKSA